MHILTKQEARDYMVSYHMINTDPLKGKDAIKEVFMRLKTIQYDPLDVVGRNSELVLQSRIDGFKRKDLNEALYTERFLIDGWDKQMSVFMTKDYPFFSRIRELRAHNEVHGLKRYLDMDILGYVDEVFDIVKEKGPIFSKDVQLGETKKHKWGRTKPSTAAIDYLFFKGDIGIHSRKGAVKKYDILENLIGDFVHREDPYPEDSEFIKAYILRRINTMGLVWNKSGVAWSGRYIGEKKLRDEYLDLLVMDGAIEELQIEGMKETFYVPKGALEKKTTIKDQVRFIAPLDNLIWDRELVKRVFDFDYKWEVYTPQAKRKYGYYVLPILYGSKFVGRVEFDKYRKEGDFNVLNIWLEEGFRQTKKFDATFERGLKRFEKYLK